MNMQADDHDWEKQLQVVLGSAPAPDFDAWRQRHADALSALKPAEPVERLLPLVKLNRRAVVTRLTWMAASLLIGIGLLWMTFGETNLSPSAFADSIPGVDDVQTMTWTSTHYMRVTSADGKRTWIRTERLLEAYRHPGQYRETLLDESGQPSWVEITDYRAGRTLALDPKRKKATLKFPFGGRDSRGPFAWVGDTIRRENNGALNRVKSVSLQGQKEIDGFQATVVRVKYVDEGSELRLDFLFDVASKQLVGIWEPNHGEDFDLETAADRNNPAEETWSRVVAIAAMKHEIVLKPKLDRSDFSLDPPSDYEFEKLAKPTVTEGEMIAYLGAAARFNDNQFPDSPYIAFDRDKFHAASEKEPEARTEVEQAMIVIRDKFMMREIYRSPVKQFVEDQTASNSFHYVGAGVTVGQADRLVAWYKLRNEKKYRALYGDLSVKDVTEAELPLK